MSTDLAPAQSAQLQAQEQHERVDPTLQWAMQNNVTPELLREFYVLQREMRQDQARAAFNEAMARFKADPPTIRKNKHVTHNNFDHATLDECVGKITPALAAVGIRHRWDIDQTKAPSITVTCILSHQMGHSESTPLTASADTSGSKNAIQAVGSAVTYLQRYTLLSATGLAAGGTDDDGVASAKRPGMSEDALRSAIDAMQGAGSTEQLRNIFKDAYRVAQGQHDRAAMDQLKEYYESRKDKVAA